MSNRKIFYESKTKYNDILVTQENNIITLYSPPDTRQTAIDVKNPTLPHLEYARNILPGLVLAEGPESILMLGLGGGAIPRMLANINSQFFIDIVEIDPEMAAVAEKYFHFKTTDRIRLFINDAFQFLKKSKKTYDIIIMDAYIGNNLPKSLSSLDFFKEADKHLSNKGVLIANLMTTDRPYYKKMLKKINSAFSEIWLLHAETSSNAIAFAMNRKLFRMKIACRAIWLKKNFPPNFELINKISKIKKL